MKSTKIEISTFKIWNFKKWHEISGENENFNQKILKFKYENEIFDGFKISAQKIEISTEQFEISITMTRKFGKNLKFQSKNWNFKKEM